MWWSIEILHVGLTPDSDEAVGEGAECLVAGELAVVAGDETTLSQVKVLQPGQVGQRHLDERAAAIPAGLRAPNLSAHPAVVAGPAAAVTTLAVVITLILEMTEVLAGRVMGGTCPTLQGAKTANRRTPSAARGRSPSPP